MVLPIGLLILVLSAPLEIDHRLVVSYHPVLVVLFNLIGMLPYFVSIQSVIIVYYLDTVSYRFGYSCAFGTRRHLRCC